MVAWFIIAIATLAIFAFIAANGVQTVAATTDGVGRVTTAQRLDAAANGLIARAGSPNGTGKYFVLAGETIGGVYGLPQELSAYATTAFGQRITYCPFGDGETGTAGTVPVGSSSSYPIQTASANGRTYVVGGRPTFPQVAENPNLLGYLIAPRTKNSATPTCNQVIYNTSTNRFEAPDALVRAVIRSSGSEEARDAQAREIVFYVSQSGTGRGLAQNDTTNFQTALDYYRTRTPANMRIVLADGNYIMSAGSLDRNSGGYANVGSDSNLSIVNANNQAFIQQTGASPIDAPGNLFLSGLTFTQNTMVIADVGHVVSLMNTTTGRALARGGGAINAINGGFIGQSGQWAVAAEQGGQISMNGTVRVDVAGGNGLIASDAGYVTMRDGTLTILNSGSAPGYGLYTDAGGTMQIRNTTVSYGYPVTIQAVAYGSQSIIGSTIQNSAGSSYSALTIGKGANVVIDNSILGAGNAPTYGFVDGGALSLTGSNSSVRGTSGCWINDATLPAGAGLFAMSSATNSAVTADEPTTGFVNPNSPTSAEVAAYTAVSSRNQRRAILRSANRSSISCS